MSDEFATNVVVPTDEPEVPEYTFPEGDYTEKTQDLLYKLDAAEAGRRLLIRQLQRRKMEIQRQLDDLEHAGDLCE